MALDRPDSSELTTLANRADFLRAARAARQGTEGFLLQARERSASEAAAGVEADTVRVGYTCSKKIGNAVMRNRAKRRLREVARSTLTRLGQPGWDYVLVGRPQATVTRAFSALEMDLARALTRIHASK